MKRSHMMLALMLLISTPTGAVGLRFYLTPFPASDPAVLALVGFGLLGLAAWARRER